MKRTAFSILVALTLAVGLGPAAEAQPKAPATGKLDRTVLPIREPSYPPITEVDARKVKAPPRFEGRAPKGAPNVVIVLIDDMGFGQPSTFGGGVAMPTLDQLAAGGLRYNQFHAAALCSPTRVVLKYGRNHHSANAGSVMEIATAVPGNQGRIPNSVAPLAEMLRLNGYTTAAFGKWHETAPWEVSVSGPFGHDARPQTAGHQGLGHALGRREAALRPPDGGLRGLRRAHRSRDRTGRPTVDRGVTSPRRPPLMLAAGGGR